MIRVVVFSDIRLYREGLREALERLPDVTVVGVAATSAAAIVAADTQRPDVAVVDVGTAGGVTALRELDRRRVKLVALTVPDGGDAMLTCAEAGVVGYVGRDGSLDQLVRAIRNASRDQVACEPALTASLVRGVRARARATGQEVAHPVGGPDPALTSRELEIARLIAFEGLSNQQIAQRLCIALPTVKNHVHNVLGKLGASRRSEAAAHLRDLDPVRAD